MFAGTAWASRPSSAQPLDRLLELVRTARRDRQPVAVLAQCPRDREPDSARSARDQRCPIRHPSPPLDSLGAAPARPGRPLPRTGFTRLHQTLPCTPSVRCAAVARAGCSQPSCDRPHGRHWPRAATRRLLAGPVVVRASRRRSSADFPSPKGKTCSRSSADSGPGPCWRRPSRSLGAGQDRYGFGLFDRARKQIAETPGGPLRRALGQREGARPVRRARPPADGEAAVPERDRREGSRRRQVALRDRPHVPHSRATTRSSAWRSSTAGWWRPARSTSACGQASAVPKVGDKAPRIDTPTAEVRRRRRLEDRHPHAARLDARRELRRRDRQEARSCSCSRRPRLCQSRVCGPVVDIAEEVKAENKGDAPSSTWRSTTTTRSRRAASTAPARESVPAPAGARLPPAHRAVGVRDRQQRQDRRSSRGRVLEGRARERGEDGGGGLSSWTWGSPGGRSSSAEGEAGSGRRWPPCSSPRARASSCWPQLGGTGVGVSGARRACLVARRRHVGPAAARPAPRRGEGAVRWIARRSVDERRRAASG